MDSELPGAGAGEMGVECLMVQFRPGKVHARWRARRMVAMQHDTVHAARHHWIVHSETVKW